MTRSEDIESARRLADADAVTDSPVAVLAVIKSARTIAQRDGTPQVVHIHILADGRLEAAAIANELPCSNCEEWCDDCCPGEGTTCSTCSACEGPPA